jgi:hypothetical protein
MRGPVFVVAGKIGYAGFDVKKTFSEGIETQEGAVTIPAGHRALDS